MKYILPLILVVIAICGFGGYTAYNTYYQSPQKIILRASQQMTELKTVHADMDITMNMLLLSSQGTSNAVESKITGLSDINIADKTQKTHLVLTSPMGNVDTDTILLKNGEIYTRLNVGELGKYWWSMNTKTLVDGGTLPVDPQSSDYVAQSLEFMKSFDTSSILKLEDEVVDGIKTSRYRIDVSTPKYIELLNSMPNGEKQSEGFENASIKSDIWIDKKTNYIVKMESTIKNLGLRDPKTNESIGSSDMVMVLAYSKFNQNVVIEKPQGEIYPYEYLMKMMQEDQAK